MDIAAFEDPYVPMPRTSAGRAARTTSIDCKFSERFLCDALGISSPRKPTRRALERASMAVPVFSAHGAYTRSDVARLAHGCQGYSSPCAASFQSVRELEESMLFLFQLSFHHYLRGVAEIGNDIFSFVPFPKYRCGQSTRNVVLSGIASGYPGMSFATARTRTLEHAYAVLPFVLGEESGAIITEPTAGQFSRSGPCVTVHVELGSRWRYPIRSYGGAFEDCYPSSVRHVGDVQADIRRYLGGGSMLPLCMQQSWEGGIPGFFEKAFTNTFTPPRLGG